MTSDRTRLWDICSLIGNAAVLHVLCILTAEGWSDPSDLRGLLIWWGVLCAAWILMNIVTRLTELSHIIPAITVASLAAQVFLTKTFGQAPASFHGWLWMLLIWAVPAFRAAEFMYKPETSEQRTLDFEFCLLSLILLAIASAGDKGDISAMPPVLFACALTLIHLALRRSGGNSGGSRFLSTAAACLIPAVLIIAGTIFFLMLKDPLAYGVQRITDTVILGIRSFLAAAGRFFAWLFSHLPQPSPEETVLPEAETQAAMSMDMTDGISGDLILTPMLLGIFGLAGASLLLMGARKLRPLPQTHERRLIHRLPLRDILRRTVQRLKTFLYFRFCCIRYRNTPEGLLCRIEAAMALRHDGRRQDESPRSFLERTAGVLPEQAEELRILADWLDRRYFSAEGFSPDREEFLRIKKALSHLS